MENKPAPIVVMRQPSTANLMLDSADRDENRFPLCNNFQISKNNALLNGFFTRIGTTEVTLEWFTPNISSAFNNNSITIDISGGAGVTGTGTVTVTLADGFRTQAAVVDALEGILDVLGSSTTPATTFAIYQLPTGASIDPSQNVYLSFTGTLATLLGLNPVLEEFDAQDGVVIDPRDLRGLRYIDFVSSQLTYNQELKDSSTAPTVRDVLTRWYMAYDNYTATDAYGYPVLMGYEPFTLRRTFSPPKQIKWNINQPLGNLAFELYGDNQLQLPVTAETNWLMTLQVSEI
jgi:hypothetical protein